MATTPKLFYVYDFEKEVNNNLENDDAIDDFLVPASGPLTGTPSTLGVDANTFDDFTGLAIDPAAGVYFISSRDEDTNASLIYEERFGQTPQYSTPIFNNTSTYATNAARLDDDVTSLAINPSDNILYFASGTGFYEEKFTGSNFSGTPQLVKLATLPATTDAATQTMAFDQTDDSAYFAAPKYFHSSTVVTTKKKPGPSHSKTATFTKTSGNWHYLTSHSVVTSNYIYKVSGATASATANSLSGSVLNLGGPSGQLPFADGVITGVTEATIGGI